MSAGKASDFEGRMGANEITNEAGNGQPARVGIIASHEVAQKIQSVLCCCNGVQAEVNALVWPEKKSSPPGNYPISPDLIVCEIQDSAQADNYQQEIKNHWPAATLISCEVGKIEAASNTETVVLQEVSQRAGYQGHLLIDELALQLPIFLRYAEQRRIIDRQSHQLLQLTNLLAAAQRIHSTLDQQQIAEEILAEFGKWVKADSWLLYALSDNEKFIELIGSEGVRNRPPSLTLRVDGKGLIERVFRQGEMVVLQQNEIENIGTVDKHQRGTDDQGQPLGSILCFPFKTGTQTVGVGQATRTVGEPIFNNDEQDALQQVSSIASLALNNAMQFARAERLYMQDDLTQLHNSRYLRQYIEAEFKRVKRYGGQVAVIFIDLDGFKGVNDRFGHRVGSETLKEAANLLMDSVRDTDVVTRYGGDEFTIVMPNTDAEKASVSAERVRQKIADHQFRGGSENTFRLTASFGIASYPECAADSAVDLLEKADLAMYRAKAANKNNVQLAKS